MPDNPKDLNGDGKVTKAEKKRWAENNSPDLVAEKWGVDLALIRQYPDLEKYFNEQFAKYQKNPTGFSDAAFIMGLKDLPSWQGMSAAAIKDREFELQYPEQWNQAIEADIATLRDQASRAGASVADDVLRDLVLKRRRQGMNDSQLMDAFSQYLVLEEDRYVGQAGSYQQELMQWLDGNGLSLDSAAVQKYVQRMSANDMTFDDVKSELRKTYLAGAYPAWADKINAGFDPSDVFSPYVSAARNLLEDDSIGLSDPIMQSITQKVSQDGKPYAVPLYEAQRMIREDPRWQKTDNAYATYANVATNLLRTFGFA